MIIKFSLDGYYISHRLINNMEYGKRKYAQLE